MNIIYTSALATALFITSCASSKRNNQASTDCPPKPCTMEFRTVGVLFEDESGDTLQVKDFSVKVKSTDKKLPSAIEENNIQQGHHYLVTSDADKSTLSELGDTLIITATHPTSGAIKTSEMVVSGGRCECHIIKKSGAEIIVFD